MKKNILIIATCLSGLNMSAQSRYNTVIESQPYVSTYVPPNYDAINAAGAAMQARYDKNKEYRDGLIKWIFDLKTKTEDQQFLDAMNVNYKKLRSFDNQDFGTLGTELSNIKNNIAEEIDNHNSRNKELPKKLWESGYENFKLGKYSDSKNELTQLISIKPDFESAYYYRGLIYSYEGSHFLAIKDFDKFIEMKPDTDYAYYARGYSKRELKNYIEAMMDFNKLIELKPNSFNGYFERARVKFELGDFIGNISDNSKAIELKPDFSMAYNNRGWTKFELKKYSEALTDLNKAIELDPTNWVAFDSRQETKFALNDLKGCFEDCNKTIELNTKCSNAYFIRGRTYYKKGNKIKACDDWSKAGELGKTEAYDFISKYCK